MDSTNYEEIKTNYSIKQENTYKEMYDTFYHLYYDLFIKEKPNKEEIINLINTINTSNKKDVALEALEDVIRDIESVKQELGVIKLSLLNKDSGGFVKVISNKQGYSFMWITGLITGIISCSLIILFAFLF